jgi:hypothetical protein
MISRQTGQVPPSTHLDALPSVGTFDNYTFGDSRAIFRADTDTVNGSEDYSVASFLIDQLLKGAKVGDKTFENHLDGYNFLPYFKGEVAEGPRHEFFYFSDNAGLMALRYNAWKISFKIIKGNLFTGTVETTDVPLVTNLRQDPWERYQDESMLYGKWWGEKLWTMVPAVTIVVGFLRTFEEYPPSQKSGSISVSHFLEAISSGANGGGH